MASVACLQFLTIDQVSVYLGYDTILVLPLCSVFIVSYFFFEVLFFVSLVLFYHSSLCLCLVYGTAEDAIDHCRLSVATVQSN